jgi:hypothetical protein
MRSAALVLCAAATACGGGTIDGADPDPDAAAVDAVHTPSADELMGALAACTQISTGLYPTRSGQPADVAVCGIAGQNVVAWTADMAIDCDGKQTTQCNLGTDPDFQSQTAAVDSNGDPLDAAALPYVVVPGPGTIWDFRTAGLHHGAVFAVIYGGQVAYAVFGDVGPSSTIGEGSYGLAAALGIDPDPSSGGVDGGVTYIGFTAPDAIADPIEDPEVATAIGVAHARALLGP